MVVDPCTENLNTALAPKADFHSTDKTEVITPTYTGKSRWVHLTQLQAAGRNCPFNRLQFYTVNVIAESKFLLQGSNLSQAAR